MTKKITKKEITTTVYISNDGKEFDTEINCLMHERLALAQKVYITFKRGKRSDEVEIFSSEDEAKKAINSYLDSDSFITKCITVNERNILNEIKKGK